ncbi:MAG: FitA-like ribbon-helix-helix domain-containing protein [Gaiellaceae bacterium]
MDTTIRNLDEDAYRQLRARAVLSGRTIGELVNEAIRSYLGRPRPPLPTSSLADLVPEDYGKGQERLSEEIDAVVYRA